jgi:4-amino-4-deoxy-L-arabinose transferase-like glycosyltransferase
MEAGELTGGSGRVRRWGYLIWLLVITGFAIVHALHLGADFPNGTPWVHDWAKYTDEGWYGNAAIRAHLFGNWYVPGDFNPAPAVPLWPFLEWLLFFITGVSAEAARGLAVACFFVNLGLSYLLLRSRGPRWMALLGLTLLATSPFLYCFSRLAILEPLQTTLLLAALNLALRLPAIERPAGAAAAVGLLFALMMLTKTTAVFLAPALGWAMVLPLWRRKKLAFGCALAAAGSAAMVYGFWLALMSHRGLLLDYKYFFFVNKYEKPPEFYWPLVSFWWSFHGLFWIDRSLVLPACAIVLAAAVAWRSGWGRALWRDPLFGASLLAVAGYIAFMTVQNHPQPRYFAVPAFFCFMVVALGAAALVEAGTVARRFGWAVIAVAAAAAAAHGAQTIGYAAHPQYSWQIAATQLTQYIDAHPNGNRRLVSISGDQITLMTHLPALCDDFGTTDLPSKLAAYRPGWYAAWNDLDPGTLEDLHAQFSLEQVASFSALDDPERNVLVLYKLHPLAGGRIRNPGDQNLRIVLPGDKIGVNVE